MLFQKDNFNFIIINSSFANSGNIYYNSECFNNKTNNVLISNNIFNITNITNYTIKINVLNDTRSNFTIEYNKFDIQSNCGYSDSDHYYDRYCGLAASYTA